MTWATQIACLRAPSPPIYILLRHCVMLSPASSVARLLTHVRCDCSLGVRPCALLSYISWRPERLLWPPLMTLFVAVIQPHGNASAGQNGGHLEERYGTGENFSQHIIHNCTETLQEGPAGLYGVYALACITDNTQHWCCTACTSTTEHQLHAAASSRAG